MKIKDIEYVTSNGERKKGDTLTDPTWNLSANKYGFKPNCFCKSYEEMRKEDIDSKGKDTESHKNDNLEDITLSIDEEIIAETYRSLGIIDEQGYYPLANLSRASKEIGKMNLEEEVAIKAQLELLSQYYPNFADSFNETSYVLKQISLNQKNQTFDKCVVNRVHRKGDKNKKTILYVYVKYKNGKKAFYCAGTQKFCEFNRRTI